MVLSMFITNQIRKKTSGICKVPLEFVKSGTSWLKLWACIEQAVPDQTQARDRAYVTGEIGTLGCAASPNRYGPVLNRANGLTQCSGPQKSIDRDRQMR